MVEWNSLLFRVSTGLKMGSSIKETAYLLEVQDKRNNALYIQLSNDGTYWNINSAGTFRKGYSRNMPKVHDRPAVGDGKGTDTTEVNSGQTEGATAPAGNSSETSEGKDNTLQAEKQADGENSSTQSAQSEIDAASADVNVNPTDGQKEAGNYKMDHVKMAGFNITIDNDLFA
jgi:hypothetical protein